MSTTTYYIDGATYQSREHLRANGWRWNGSHWEKVADLHGLAGIEGARALAGNRRGCRIIGKTSPRWSLLWQSATFVAPEMASQGEIHDAVYAEAVA